MNSLFINYNGKIFHFEENVLSIWNRGLRYGDGLFETIRIHEGEILFFEDHLERMFSGMKALRINVPDYFSEFFFHKQILDLAYKNQVQKNARIRITISRKGNGLYEPRQSDPEYFIEMSPLNKGFEWSDDPCELGVFREVPKDFSSISFFKSLNALPYVMAGVFRKESNLGDCVVVNSFGKVADAISANLFWIKDESVMTTPVTDGGIDGVMRKNLILTLAKNQVSVTEKSISPEALKDTDEIFLTNVGWGIKPVTKFEGKMFTTLQTKELFRMLMQALEK